MQTAAPTWAPLLASWRLVLYGWPMHYLPRHPDPTADARLAHRENEQPTLTCGRKTIGTKNINLVLNYGFYRAPSQPSCDRDEQRASGGGPENRRHRRPPPLLLLLRRGTSSPASGAPAVLLPPHCAGTKLQSVLVALVIKPIEIKR